MPVPFRQSPEPTDVPARTDVPAAPDAAGTIRVFVHLGHGQDARQWRERWSRGELAGLNDSSPYGYARADAMGCAVTFSRAHPENAFMKLVRGGLRVALGFDLVHALRNAGPLLASDVVWTHTESQLLGVAAALKLLRPRRRPRILGQSVWLMDEWERLTPLHRALYRALIGRVDMLTFLSPDNLTEARRRLAGVRMELVLYGIATDALVPPVPRPDLPIRVLAVGNDRHRDWKTLAAALGSRPGIELTIASRTADPGLARTHANVTIRHVTRNDELDALYRACTLMVVPLRPNLHASGITVMQEAAVLGVPLVATDTGGLRAYFDDEAVAYVPVSDPQRLLDTVHALARDGERRLALARAAQRRMETGALGCEAFVRRHVELSREMLGR